jgi:hypothetical protein
MTTVLLSAGSTAEEAIPVLGRVRLTDRLCARLAARRLDVALAAGASPDHSAALSLRAQTLVGAPCRARLARGLDALLRRAQEPRQPMFDPYAPLPRERVLACRAELGAIADALRGLAAVDAGGVAGAMLLITDGAGPLFGQGHDASDLRRALLRILEALEPHRR